MVCRAKRGRERGNLLTRAGGLFPDWTVRMVDDTPVERLVAGVDLRGDVNKDLAEDINHEVRVVELTLDVSLP
jgi:hypothetical protein